MIDLNEKRKRAIKIIDIDNLPSKFLVYFTSTCKNDLYKRIFDNYILSNFNTDYLPEAKTYDRTFREVFSRVYMKDFDYFTLYEITKFAGIINKSNDGKSLYMLVGDPLKVLDETINKYNKGFKDYILDYSYREGEELSIEKLHSDEAIKFSLSKAVAIGDSIDNLSFCGLYYTFPAKDLNTLNPIMYDLAKVINRCYSESKECILTHYTSNKNHALFLINFFKMERIFANNNENKIMNVNDFLKLDSNDVKEDYPNFIYSCDDFNNEEIAVRLKRAGYSTDIIKLDSTNYDRLKYELDVYI